MQVYIGNPGKLSQLETIKSMGYGLVRLANHWNYPKPSIPWFLDNGAFSYFQNGQEFNANNFYKTLDKLPLCCSQPDFIVCPDKVLGGLASLKFSLSWLPVIPADLPVYLAVQDGMSPADIKPYLSFFDGLFVGGSYGWKFKTVRTWAQLAHSHKLLCHVGRIGTYKNLVFCRKAGADSVDSSTFAQINSHQRKYGKNFLSIETSKNQADLLEFC